MLSWIRYKWTGFCLLLLGLTALSLFLYGFFPLKYHSGKFAHLDDLPNFIDNVSIDGHEVYNTGENTVILMVIDALRYDFVTEEYMPFTGGLMKNKSACIYVSVAEPPTVTMPRIKAMMTGCVSTFADVALNFGAPAVKGDSVLRAAHAKGRKTIMYGDDTWLRLFPGLWSEYDGTTSFYVTDYTEVDQNVTRHLDKALAPDENKKPTFDFLVLHYLGLDHIGHLEGARSPKIKPKLIEMDDVIKKIFTAMQKWDRPATLLVCGDHGMRDAGGHGGATPAEVLVPLVVARTQDFQCPHPAGPGPTVAQVDVAPSISWLLNAPIPGDSTGRILPSLLPTDVRQHLYLLHVLASHNAKMLALPSDKEFYKQFERAEKQFGHYLATGQKSAAKIAKEFYEESLEVMSKYLAESTVDFDLFAIGVAIVVLYFIAAALAAIIIYSLQPENSRKLSANLHLKRTNAGTIVAFLTIFTVTAAFLTISCFITETKSQICSFDPLWIPAFVVIAFTITSAYFVVKSSIEKTKDLSFLKELNAIDYWLIIGSLLHPWTFFGTSFIEEEHMTWYFYWNTLMFFVLVRTIVVLVMYFSKKLLGSTEVQEKPELEQKMSKVGISIVPKWILLIALHRYLRTMNQTGDRWQFLPDTADWLNAPENSFYLQCHLVIGTLLTMVICLYNLRYMNNISHIHTVFTIAATLCIFCFRIATKSLDSPFHDIRNWDDVDIVTIFWAILIIQAGFEISTYIGVYRTCKVNTEKRFAYKKAKAKTEDYFYDDLDEEPWNLEEVRFNLSRGLMHLMLNDMMLIIILLMRPHNVIMVPSIILTCKLTTQCLDHKLLDSSQSRRTEAVDTLSQTLVHIWIGMVFFFYQGNSNSLASVDLGAGYVGLRVYNAARVAARMGLHAYAGPALAGAALFAQTPPTQYKTALWRTTTIYAFHRIYCIVVYCVVATFFRHHLFVWSVFSPKLLYDFVSTVFTVQALATIGQIVIVTHVTSWLAKNVARKWL